MSEKLNVNEENKNEELNNIDEELKKDDPTNKNINEIPLANVDEIANTLVENMPEIQEHVVHNYQTESEKNQVNSIFPPDSAGTAFDPEIHILDDDGKPKITKTGKYAKKRGRKSTVVKPDSGFSSDIDKAAQLKAQARLTGEGYTNLFLAFSQGLGGPEWAPRSFDEKHALQESFVNYCEATGRVDLPPGWSLIATLSMYAMPRFMEGEQTKSRVQKVKEWFATKLVKIKLRRSKPNTETQPETKSKEKS